MQSKRHFISGDLVAFDTETTGLAAWHGDAPFAMSFCNEAGDTAYFEFDVDPFTRRVLINSPEDRAKLAQIKAFLEDPTITKIMHNGKFDIRVVEQAFGIIVAGPGGPLREGGKFHETSIMAHNCNSLEINYKLKSLCKRLKVMGDEDEKDLQAVVRRLRRKAKKYGWKIAYGQKVNMDGTITNKAEVAADYWLPRAFAQHHPDDLQPGDVEACQRYATCDAERTMLLYQFYSQLITELNVQGIYDLEMALWPVVYQMETRGPGVSMEFLEKALDEARNEAARLLHELKQWTKDIPEFTGKDEEVRTLFYQILGLEVTRWTSGGKTGLNKKPAVNKFALMDHLKHPCVKTLAIYRSHCKVFSAFFSNYKRLSTPDPAVKAGFSIHCEYRQTAAATGRLSSAAPNLQNVMTPENTMAIHPIAVRPAFIVRPDHAWLSVDYSGMEVRVFAAVSGEPSMMAAIEAGRSIHDEMTNMVWGGRGNEDGVRQMVRALSLNGVGELNAKVKALWDGWGLNLGNINKLSERDQMRLAEEVFAKYDYNIVLAQDDIGRKNSKTYVKYLTFLKIYGGGAYKASLILNCPEREAHQTLILYDKLFPRIKEYAKDLQREAKRNGYITTRWGRRLTINEDKAYRCVNYMVQGSSADLMKTSMVRVHQYLKETGRNAHILLTVHDELILEVHYTEMTRRFVQDICAIMSDPQGHLPFDMPVTPKIAKTNWNEKAVLTL